MPSKNSRKEFLENGYYHIYNRGVEKRKIYLDQQDYAVFLSYLKEYLTEKNEKELYEILNNPQTSYQEKDKILKQIRLNNFYQEIKLVAYCLMPNHFHFFIKQNKYNSISKFMNSLCTRYTMYFNKKYDRVGFLYQGVYRAVLIKNESQFLQLSRYIHKQALPFQPSSFKRYLNQNKTEWIYPEEVLSYFSIEHPKLSYQDFVIGENEENINFALKDIILDDD